MSVGGHFSPWALCPLSECFCRGARRRRGKGANYRHQRIIEHRLGKIITSTYAMASIKLSCGNRCQDAANPALPFSGSSGPQHLPHRLAEIEAGWILTLWVGPERIQVLLHERGCRHDRPELFACVERVVWGLHVLLEWVRPEIHRPRHGRRHCLPSEPIVLDLEVDFPVVDANGVEVSLAVVEELAASRFLALTREVRQLIITVEVHFVGFIAGLVPREQLLLHVRDARGGHDGRHHILKGENPIKHLARGNPPRPAHHEGHAESTLPAKSLLAAERGGPAIRPAELLRAVVRCEDDNGVFSDTQLVELVQEFTDDPIELRHPIGVKAVLGLVLPAVRQTRPHVHARRVVPQENGLLAARARPMKSNERWRRSASTVSIRLRVKGPLSLMVCFPTRPKRGSTVGSSFSVVFASSTPRGPNFCRNIGLSFG